MDISTPRSNLVVRFLSVFLLCCTSLYASADQTGKQKITVIANDVTLETVFKQIEKQTGLRFMYAVDAVNVKEKVTVAFDKVILDDVLGSLLGKKGIEWVYREGVISLKFSNASSPAIRQIDLTAAPLINVSGRILDANGKPIPGATIMVKGTKKGTKTDSDGSFIIVGVEENSILLVSSIGFETKEFAAQERNLLIKMNEVIGRLDETVIVGYGITTQRLNIGNVVSIKADEIAKNPVSDPLLVLQGRVTGMTVNQTTGLSGGQIKVQIRGLNSIKRGVQPLFIVDGVPYEPNMNAAPLGGYGALGTTISSLNFINPADIQSIDILKDADATAIYGSRGANGVILITTKKGNIGNAKVDVNINNGWQSVDDRLNLLNTEQYLEMRREAFKNDGVNPDAGNAPDLFVWDTTRYTDWQDKLIGGTAKYMDAQIGISGGTTAVQYVLGGNYHRETTIFPGKFPSQRGGAHLNIIGNSQNQRLRTSLTANYIISKTNFPGFDFANYINLPPNAPNPYKEDGSLNWENSTWDNPYAQLHTNSLDGQTTNLISNIDISYRILTDLNIKLNIGFNELRGSAFTGSTIAGVDPSYQQYFSASGNYTNNKTQSWITEPQLTYSKSVGKNLINLLVGATLLGNKSDNQYISMGGINQDALIRNPGSATSYFVTGGGNSYRYMAFFGRLSYNFDNKYLMNLTIRRDGSSRFGPNSRFANFGSIGAGWIFSEAGFLKEALPFLSLGKLRGSYGITGNDQIGDYMYLDQYKFVDQKYMDQKGLKVMGLFNPDFVWEKTRKGELGLEMGFLKDKIFFNASYYITRSDNQLLDLPLPEMTGAASVTGNLPAIIRNTGFEFILTSQNLKSSHVEWSTSFNLSVARNKLVAYDQSYGTNVKEGQSLSEKYLYEVYDVDPASGVYRFLNKEGKPDIGLSADAFHTSVNLAPAFFGGLQNNIRFRNFNLGFLLQFVKQKGASGTFFPYSVPGSKSNQPVAVLERWRKIGDHTAIQRFSHDFSLYQDYSAWLGSDRMYVDASFIRCKNIYVSWEIPGRLKQSTGVNSARIYLQAQNLFTITRYPGWDPETQTVTSIPPLRVVSLGFQISL